MTDLPANYQSPKLASTLSFTQKVLIWIQAMRAPFFTASIVPLVLGMAISWNEHQTFDPILGFLTLLSGVTIHAGTNLCNDYFDQAADILNKDFTPFSGGSRMIQNQTLEARQILVASIICYIIGILTAIFIVIVTNGILLVIFLLVAVLLGIFYTAFPVRFSYRGLGEIAVFVGFGPLGVLSAYYIQVGRLDSFLPLIASVPIALLIAMVLFLNEFQDYEADKAAGKNTLVVSLGKEASLKIYVTGMILAYVSLTAVILIQRFSLPLLLPFITLPLAIKAIRIAIKQYAKIKELEPSNALTILNHFSFGILMAAAFMIA
ncbi:MAG: 1,4-dihydroxy-2-naphthoate octaprenyltransferase [Candidatus Hodarchaeales archaeon]|jgi:1,4-dihydroxy-2-naphthoate octaprenyltransferase